jgi:tetratricopeptide (TPR) repeat protein
MSAGEKRKPIEGAPLIAAKCPTCGGILTLRGRGAARCEFCGNEFILHESYQGKSREIRNFYDLAYAALEIGDTGAAYDYFTKVLELDSTEALAWYGKGVAALGYAKTRHMRTAEAVSLFNRALANVEGEEKNQLRETIQKSCFHYADSFFDFLWNRGLLSGGNVREVWPLIDFADEVLRLENEQMKRVVTLLCAHPLLAWPERKGRVDRFTKRIRATEPAYLNPWEEEEACRRRAQTPVKVNRREFYLGVLLACFLMALVCLICFFFYYASTAFP